MTIFEKSPKTQGGETSAEIARHGAQLESISYLETFRLGSGG
jgi:hypothetical protein